MTPPPRLVPDRPSARFPREDVADSIEQMLLGTYTLKNQSLPGDVDEVLRDAIKHLRAAAPPAEAGGAVMAELGSLEMAIRHLITAKQWTENAMRSRFDSIRAQLAAAPAAPAEGVSRADAEVMVDGIIETAWLEGSEHRKAWGQRLMDLRNELVRTLTAPRVTGGRDSERMDFVEMHCLLCLDSVSGKPDGNGQRKVAATRKNIDAAHQAATGGEG